LTHVLLIDGNHLGYASMYVPALSHLQHEGSPTGGIMGLVQSVIRISARFHGAVPVVLWDGHAAWRKELCPEYKENRKDKPEKVAVTESWRRQQPHAAHLLLQMGVLQLRATNAEADDLAGLLAMETSTFDDFDIDRITLVSGDTDWWQALSERVDWLSPITDKTVTLADLQTDAVKDGPFSSPEEYLLAKAIAGDASDNIPGVPGVGILTARKLLRKFGGLDGIADAVAFGAATDRKSAAIAEHRETVERNLRIMDWRLAPTPSAGFYGYVRLSFEPEACQELCSTFGLQRLSGRLGPEGEWSRLIEAHRQGVAPVIDFVESHAR
jgi:5'-3' exonuclease